MDSLYCCSESLAEDILVGVTLDAAIGTYADGGALVDAKQGEGLGQLRGTEAALVTPTDKGNNVDAIALQVTSRESRVVHVGDLGCERGVSIKR